MRPRFSLRRLLIFTAVVAAGCYWWIARPTNVANRFRSALAAQDFEAAERLCVDPNRGFVNRTVAEFQAGRSIVPFPIGSTTTQFPVPITVDVQVVRRTWQDLFRGQRRLKMMIDFDYRGDTFVFVADSIANDGFGTWPNFLELTATTLAVHPPMDERQN
jgi:hypothetical protein